MARVFATGSEGAPIGFRKRAGEWINGQNVHIDIRAGAGDADRLRIYADRLTSYCPPGQQQLRRY